MRFYLHNKLLGVLKMWKKSVCEEDLPELPPITKKVFLQFYTISDGNIAHPRDRERFLEFIRYCHGKNVRLSEVEFKSMLIRIGCSESKAKNLSQFYANAREVLKADFPYIPKLTKTPTSKRTLS